MLPTPSLRKNNSSFTLTELLVLIAALFIVITLALPPSSFWERTFLQQELQGLESTIVFLQQKAIARGSEERLSFDLANHTYSYPTMHNRLASHRLAREVLFGTLPHAHGPPSKPTTMLDRASTFPDDRIVFFPTGVATSGTIYLKTKSSALLAALTCAVSQATCTRRYFYDRGRWQTA